MLIYNISGLKYFIFCSQQMVRWPLTSPPSTTVWPAREMLMFTFPPFLPSKGRYYCWCTGTEFNVQLFHLKTGESKSVNLKGEIYSDLDWVFFHKQPAVWNSLIILPKIKYVEFLVSAEEGGGVLVLLSHLWCKPWWCSLLCPINYNSWEASPQLKMFSRFRQEFQAASRLATFRCKYLHPRPRYILTPTERAIDLFKR